MSTPRGRQRRPAPPVPAVIALLWGFGDLLKYVWRTNPRLIPIVVIAAILALVIGYSAFIAPLTPFLYPLF
jgi:CHASE2 domain-containing sensor protein